MGLNTENVVAETLAAIKTGALVNLSPVLPMLLSLRGMPLTLKDHILWEPLFKTEVPKKRTIKSARQCGKYLLIIRYY